MDESRERRGPAGGFIAVGAGNFALSVSICRLSPRAFRLVGLRFPHASVKKHLSESGSLVGSRARIANNISADWASTAGRTV